MTSQTVKKILETEAQANKKLSTAKNSKNDIISDAQAATLAEYEKQIALAKNESEKISLENNQKIDTVYRETQKKAEAQKELIKKQADANMSAATDAVINAFFDD